MQYLFLLSAIYNSLAASILWSKQSHLIMENGDLKLDNTQFRFFTGATATIFAVFDFYLFSAAKNLTELHALLLLAILLKLWCFVLISMNLKLYQQPVEDFIPIGLVNGIFIILFISYLY